MFSESPGIRGICSLRPGIPGLSENIQIRSIVGRFLEHSRVYYFGNNGKEEFFCASADWMDRNFFRRNETCFPIKQKPLKKRLWSDLELFLADNTGAWILQGDGTYELLRPGDDAPVSAQQIFLDQFGTASQDQPDQTAGRNLTLQDIPAPFQDQQ